MMKVVLVVATLDDNDAILHREHVVVFDDVTPGWKWPAWTSKKDYADRMIDDAIGKAIRPEQ